MQNPLILHPLLTDKHYGLAINSENSEESLIMEHLESIGDGVFQIIFYSNKKSVCRTRALEISQFCKANGITFIVCGDLEIAVQSNADGLHLKALNYEIEKDLASIKLSAWRWPITGKQRLSKIMVLIISALVQFLEPLCQLIMECL